MNIARTFSQGVWKAIPIAAVFVIVILSVRPCFAQESSARLLLKIDQTSSGPFAGQRGSLCVQVYSNGRVVYSDWSRSGIGIVDKTGKETRSEKTVSLEYRVPEKDSWEISELEDFLVSKPVLHLSSYFAPPHRPIDFFETSLVQIVLPTGMTKRINLREFYVASLVEKAKYPSALVILMDRIARIEDEVSEKGKPIEPPADCQLQKQ